MILASQLKVLLVGRETHSFNLFSNFISFDRNQHIFAYYKHGLSPPQEKDKSSFSQTIAPSVTVAVSYLAFIPTCSTFSFTLFNIYFNIFVSNLNLRNCATTAITGSPLLKIDLYC